MRPLYLSKSTTSTTDTKPKKETSKQMSTLLSFSCHPTIKSHQVTDTTYNCIYTFITNLKTMQTKERNQLKEIPHTNPDEIHHNRMTPCYRFRPMQSNTEPFRNVKIPKSRQCHRRKAKPHQHRNWSSLRTSYNITQIPRIAGINTTRYSANLNT